MKRVAVILSILSSLSSCRLYDKIFKVDLVARIGSHTLYNDDIRALHIQGFSPQDSTRLVHQYIYSWATNKLLLDMADKQLAKHDKDVEEQLEDYRQQLLIFRYEKQYVEQRLDTLVTEGQISDYYNSHIESYRTDVSLVKGTFIKISSTSPNISLVRSLYKSNTPEKQEQLAQVCYSSAEVFSIYDNWTPLDQLAQKMGSDVSYCESALSKGNYIEHSDISYTYLFKVSDMAKKGTFAPLDYSADLIRDVILNKRKQELIKSLERNLLEDAVSTNRLIIY